MAITSATLGRRQLKPLHPLHAVLLAATVPLFFGALLSDIAYARSEEIQWSNFASWLIVGGMVFCGCALVWAAIEMLRSDRRAGQAITYVGLLLATFVFGLVNALIHAKDAWAIMPEGLILSIIVAALAISATWVGFSSLRAGATT